MKTKRTQRRLFSRTAGTLALTARRAATVLLLMVLTTASAWAWDGEGTQESPYQIKNASDLQQLATNVNDGTDYSNKYFKQIADINMQGVAFTPIGTADHPFNGKYDGNSKTITNLNVSGNYQYAGLFGFVKGGDYHGETNAIIAEVHGVVLVNPAITVTVNGTSSSEQFAGAVVGLVNDCARLYDNTVIGGSVTYTGGSNYNTNYSYAGGLAGSYANSNLARFSGNKVSGTTVSGGGISGGLVGRTSNSSFYDNFADANVSSAESSFSGADGKTVKYHTQGALVGSYQSRSSTVTSVNHYHSASGLTAYGSYAIYSGQTRVVDVPDDDWADPLYTVTAPSGLTVGGSATVTVGTNCYFAAGATATLTTDANHIIIGTPTISGTGAALGTVATDRHSVTATIGAADATVTAFRAYFDLGGAHARQFVLNFGEETNAVFDLNNKEERRNNSWYSLDGVKLDGEPTKKGLYIYGGRKVVIK